MAIIYDENGTAGKVCNKCSEWKSLDAYSRHNIPHGDGYLYTCRVCHSAARRAARIADPEKFRAPQRDYYANNSEKIKNNIRAYRTTNPERLQETHREYYKRNREQRKIAQRFLNVSRRKKEGDTVRAYHGAYYRLRRDADPKGERAKEREYENRRRAHKYQAGGTHTEVEWEAVKASYAHTCLRCNRSEPEIAITRDHVVPLSEGGTDDIGNLQPLCFSCNSSKGTKTIDYRADWHDGHSKAD